MSSYGFAGILLASGFAIYVLLWLLFHIVNKKRENPNKKKRN